MSGRRYRIVPLVGALGLLGLGCGSSGGSGSCGYTTTDAGDGGTDAGYSMATDPKNCGACGHDCRGGACSAGVCQPVALVLGFGAPPASSLGWSHPQRIAVDGENVYVTRLDTIVSIPVLGNKLTTVVSTPSAPQALTLDATHLYFTIANSARRALKTPTDAGSMQLFSVGQTLGAGVAVDDTNVYWAASGAISFAPLAAKSGTPLATAQNSPFALALDDTNVYFTDFGGGRVGAAAGDGAVMSVPKAGGTATALSTSRPGPYDIAVNAHGVFWIEVGATDADGAVMKTSPAGGDPVTLASSQNLLGGLAVDEDNVYFTAGGSVWKVPDSGASAPVALATAQLNPRAVAVDTTSVYWIAMGDPKLGFSNSSVMRVAK